MRLYHIIVGSIALILAVFFLASASFLMPLALILLSVSVLFISFALFGQKIVRLKKALIIFLSFLSSLVLLLFTLTLIFIAINYPPEKPFTEQFDAIVLKPDKETFYKELNHKMAEFSKKVPGNSQFNEALKKYDYAHEEVAKALLDTEKNRKEIFDILKVSPFSIPDKYFIYRYSHDIFSYEQQVTPENPETQMCHNENHISIFRLELAEIKKLLVSKNYLQGVKKYKDIWKAEYNLLSSNNIEIIDSLMSLSVLRSIINFYYENKGLIRKDDLKDLYQITGNITSKIDSSFSLSLAKEYRIVLHNLKLIGPKWPFFDYYKTCRLFHDKYYDLSQCIKDSKYKMRTTRFDLTPDKFLENPVGNYGAYVSLNLYDGILKSVWETKNMIDKFNEITN